MEYSIRSYSEQDYDFVWDLHILANQSYIDRHMNVDETIVRQRHDERINDSKGFMIEQNNQPIGCYFMLDKADCYELGRFFIVPEMQGKGLGTDIIKNILNEYAVFKKPILIHVWKDNPVQEFWKKFGFVFYKGNDPFTDMIYRF